MLKDMLENVRAKNPLIHNITNYVTVNDCANILIACGASPIMADDSDEAAQMTAICGGLNINIGTLNKNTIPSMFAAGLESNRLGHATVLDPVGAGASVLRTQTAHELLQKTKLPAIKGNTSEIKTLQKGCGNTRGVDADAADGIDDSNEQAVVKAAMSFAERTGSVIIVTGQTDIVADSECAYVIKNGCAMMGKITGAGCMLSAMLTAYLAANKDNRLEAAAAAVTAMGVCGELASERMSAIDGNSSYRNYLIDAVYNLDGDKLEKRAKIKLCR